MPPLTPAAKTVHAVLWALCLSHLFNDTFQSLIPAAFPLFQRSLLLNYLQIGLISGVFQIASSLFQPIIGWYTDRHPMPYALPAGMTSTLIGILLLSQAGNFYVILIAVTFIGIGSAVFHPESSRLAYIASGGHFGFAQSIFQVGGNTGASFGPLLTAVIVTKYGQQHIAWFGILALIAIVWMVPLSRWYARKLKRLKIASASLHSESAKAENENVPAPSSTGSPRSSPTQAAVSRPLFILLTLVFSKNLYTCSFSTFLTMYLIEKYGISIEDSQMCLFAFLGAIAAGTFFGGPAGDRFGRKWVIWFSILGAAPFALALPYVQSFWGTCALSMLIGAIMASSFPAILIFAQELMPGKVGTIGGLFFGFSFGAAAIASVTLGGLAYCTSIDFVFYICSYMPLIGLLTWFLPNVEKGKT